MAKLGEYCEVNPSKVTLSDDTLVSFIPMTAVSEGGAIDVSATKAYVDVKTGFTCFQNGDVLFAKITPCMENGKGAIADNLYNGIGFGSTEFHVLRPDTTRLDSKYLYYCTVWPTFRKDCERNMTGSAGQKRVPKKYIETYDVSIPDLPTQRRIAATLDKVSDGIAVCRQMLADLDVMVKARFVEMFGDPEINPMGWDKRPLSQIIEHANNGMARRGNDDDGNIVLRLVELQDGYFDYSNPNRIVLSEGEKKRYLLKENDFLFARVNGNPDNVGRCAVFHDIGEDVYHNDHIIRVHFNEALLDGAFASALFNSDYGKRQLRNQIKTSAGQYTVSQDGIGAIIAILPPIIKQQQFADCVAQADKSKSVVQQQLTELETLKKALMQKYFG